MKKFENETTDATEKAIRRGFTVPPGAVNLAWAKSPSWSPKNNVIIIDTSRVAGENAGISSKTKQLGYANYMGILEDEHGNQIWDEEYPILSDEFLREAGEILDETITVDDILPYVHVSRHFHVDFVGLTFSNGLKAYSDKSIRVVDKNGNHYVDADGNKKYKTYIVPATSNQGSLSVDSTYRVYAFVDMDPERDELYLTYNKVEIAANGSLRDQQIDYKEQINPRPYFRYVPEESDVVDLVQGQQKVYSTKPVNIKQRLLNIPQTDHQGWKIFVPRKAIPDPRIFQLFRWRLACEYTKPEVPDPESSLGQGTISGIIRAGVIVPKGGTHLTTRANYLFYQLNHTDYNFSNIKFVNPLKSPDLAWHEAEQRVASYWHVDIDSVTPGQLEQFDVLIWAPTGNTDVSTYNAKIEHFTQVAGGTLILETSSLMTFSGLNGFTFSAARPSLITATGDRVVATDIRLYDATPDDPNDEFSSFGMWKSWPPNVADILTSYTDTGSILADAGPIAGWSLTTAEKADVTVYDEVPNVAFQYITAFGNGFKKVLEGKYHSNTTYHPTMVHKKFNGGGNIFVSTACTFEDHLFLPNGDMAARTMQVETFNHLKLTIQSLFDQMVSSNVQSVEQKVRLNTMLLATIFKPSPAQPSSTSPFNNNDRQSITVYSDWQSSWTINPANGVLTDDEINAFNFVLQTTSPTDTEPVWQRILTNKTADQMMQGEINKLPDSEKQNVLKAIAGATKRYMVMVTNPNVQVPATANIANDTVVTAWTNAYSPPFTIPYHLGSFAIRDEMVAGVGVGNGRRVYPPKPYELKASATYINTGSVVNEVTTRISMTAQVKRYLQVKDEPVTRRVWVAGPTTYPMIDFVLHWNKNGANALTFPNYDPHSYPSQPPIGIDTWADAHYGFKANNWPYCGRYGRISRTENNRHSDVIGIQRVLNQHVFFKDIPGPYLLEDGFYGAATEQKVIQFQQWKGAQYIDGIVDAETFSLIGYSLLGFARLPGWWDIDRPLHQWSRDAVRFMTLETISDDNPESFYGRQSLYEGGPTTISQAFWLQFTKNDLGQAQSSFDIYQVNIMPWYPARLDYLDINTRIGDTFTGYSFTAPWPGNMHGKWADDGQWIQVPIYVPCKGNNVVFILSTDYPAGRGSARHLGIRDVAVYARRPGTPVQTGSWQDIIVDPGGIRTVEKTDTVTFTARATFPAGTPVIFNAMSSLAYRIQELMDNEIEANLQSQSVASVMWNTGSVTYPDDGTLSSFFDVTFKDFATEAGFFKNNEASFTFNGYGLTTSANRYIAGPVIGNGANQFYTSSKDKVLDPYPKTYGWISKEDDIRLICKSDGTPYGFPTSQPTLASDDAYFTRYSLNASNVDQTVYYGFYDQKRGEFITDSNGRPSLSYYDYIRRGPNNVYIAVKTSYELDTTSNLPSATDSIMRPFKWAMPIYGVVTKYDAKIQLAPLSPDLGVTDHWPVPVKMGNFTRSIQLKLRSSGGYTTALKDYQGTTVTAYYDIPEAKNGPWSQLYGRPYVDVKDETPLITDDNQFQVRRYPILLVQEPAATPGLADPWIPVIDIYTRATLSSPWVQKSLYDIEDYDATRGIITMKTNLPGNDPRLIKVSYTSHNKVFNLKYDGTTRVNLNPYINNSPTLLNKPIYIYVLPQYVMDANYNVIAGTKLTRTLRITTDPSIFGPSNANYDPTAIMLGMVYLTPTFDINDLSILDTRKRGGGLSTAYTDDEGIQLDYDTNEVEHFWDITPAHTTSYQRGGFVVIRLPQEIVNDYTEQEVINAIERNITLGVQYKIESLQGEKIEWVDSE